MFYIFDEFNRLTGHDVFEKFKEHLIVFAEGIIVIKNVAPIKDSWIVLKQKLLIQEQRN